MPIFDYQCQACGHHFDVLQRISEDALTDCPACGKPELKKLLSAPNIQFKGSGWNKTAEQDKPALHKQYAHTFDSATPHADHDHSHGHSHDHGHSHSHGHDHVHDHSHKPSSKDDISVKPVGWDAAGKKSDKSDKKPHKH